MTGESKLKECSFFLVQYVPDLVRDECLNIGVFLHSPEEKYLGCLFTDDLRRVKRFHPEADLELLRELQQDFEREIDERGEDLEGYVRYMQESFSNLIQVTPPRSCLLRDPQTEIRDLFERYVGPRKTGSVPQDSRIRIKQRLTAAFARAGVWERLDKRVRAEQWTQKGDPFTFDFGYKPLVVEGRPDGLIKLTHALSLRRDPDIADLLAVKIARVRGKEPAHLTAVVEALPADDDETANYSHRVLLEHQIAVQPLAQVDDYAASVRRELLM